MQLRAARARRPASIDRAQPVPTVASGAGQPAGRGARPLLHTPEESAAIIGAGCTASWLREQARLRRIPFALIGGKYGFSDQHLFAIIEQFEVKPESATRQVAPRRTSTPPSDGAVATLRARRPQRRRSA